MYIAESAVVITKQPRCSYYVDFQTEWHITLDSTMERLTRPSLLLPRQQHISLERADALTHSVRGMLLSGEKKKKVAQYLNKYKGV